MANGEFIKRDAMIRFYFHEDTDKMDDETFCIRWEQLKFVLKQIGQYK